MKPHERIYRVTIIGAGRIASGFDTPRSRTVLTHAHAILSNRRLTLAGMTQKDLDDVVEAFHKVYTYRDELMS